MKKDVKIYAEGKMLGGQALRTDFGGRGSRAKNNEYSNFGFLNPRLSHPLIRIAEKKSRRFNFKLIIVRKNQSQMKFTNHSRAVFFYQIGLIAAKIINGPMIQSFLLQKQVIFR